jgi:sigma-B regulation protein RsbU (phosphoserine phosphatase)
MLRRDGRGIALLEAKGIALGVMPDIGLEEREISLQEGDMVVLYTDGVTEAINNKEEQFGKERLISIAEKNCSLPASELVKRIQQEITEFSQGQPQFDDLTLMILKVA